MPSKRLSVVIFYSVLVRCHYHIHYFQYAGTRTQDLHRQCPSGVFTPQPCQQFGRLGNRRALYADYPIPYLQTRVGCGRASYHLADAQSGSDRPVVLAHPPSGQSRHIDGHPQIRPPYLTMAQQLQGYPAHGIDSDGKSQALCSGDYCVFTPITHPLLSSSGPPELPGFKAASVYTTSSMVALRKKLELLSLPR